MARPPSALVSHYHNQSWMLAQVLLWLLGEADTQRCRIKWCFSCSFSKLILFVVWPKFKERCKPGSKFMQVGGAHLWVLSPTPGWLKGVRSLDNLLGGGRGFVRGVVRTLLNHGLALLALWCWRSWAFTQDWWAGGSALVWVTGSAGREERQVESKTSIKQFF